MKRKLPSVEKESIIVPYKCRNCEGVYWLEANNTGKIYPSKIKRHEGRCEKRNVISGNLSPEIELGNEEMESFYMDLVDQERSTLDTSTGNDGETNHSLNPGGLNSPQFDARASAIFDFQMKICEKFEAFGVSPQFRIRKKKRPNEENDHEQKEFITADWEDYVDIFSMVLDEGLPFTSGDAIIELIMNIFKRHNKIFGSPQYRAMHNACTNLSDHYTKALINITLDEEFLGRNPKSVRSWCLSVEEQIGRALLLKNPCNFVTEYQSLCVPGSEEKSRLHSGFEGSDVFKKACASVSRRFKDRKDVFPLCIGLTSDGTTLNSSRSRSATPFNVYFLNDCRESMSMVLLGLLPGDHLPYSEDELQKRFYDAMGTSDGVKTMAKDYFRMLKRTVTTEYIYRVLSPILKYSETGFKVQIGMGVGKKIMLAVPFFVVYSGDNMELYKLIGSSFLHKKFRCRMCLTEDVSTISVESPVMRNDAEMQQIMQRSGNSFKLRLLQKKHGKQYQDDTGLEIDVIAEADAHEKNVAAHQWKPNDIYKLFDSDIISLHQALAPDILHNFQLGCMKDSIAWTLSIIQNISKLDVKFGNALSTLNARFVTFPRRQALPFFKEVILGEGITKYFNTSGKSSEKGTGFGGGALEGWKYPTILMQLFFSVDKCILPEDVRWWKNCRVTVQKNVNFAILDTVKKCLSINLELWTWLQAKAISEANLKGMSFLIKKFRLSLVNLFSCKYYLQERVGTKKPCSGSPPAYRAIKHHIIEHIVDGIRNFGAANAGTDTQISEKSHKNIKAAFQRTSKMFKSFSGEILQVCLHKLGVEDMRSVIASTRNWSCDEDQEEFFDDKVSSTTSKSVGKNENMFQWVPNMDLEILTYSVDKGHWVLFGKEDQEPKLLSPLLNLKKLYDTISKKRLQAHFTDECENQLDLVEIGLTTPLSLSSSSSSSSTKVLVSLMGQLRGKGMKEKNIPPFQLYATKDYIRRGVSSSTHEEECKRPAFSFVETNYVVEKSGISKEQRFVGKSCCFLSFEEVEMAKDRSKGYKPIENGRSLMLGCFVFLKDEKSGKSSSFVQRMCYENLELDIISLNNILSPAFVVPDPGGSTVAFTDDENITNYKKRRFSWIPSEFLLRNDGVVAVDEDYMDSLQVQQRLQASGEKVLAEEIRSVWERLDLGQIDGCNLGEDEDDLVAHSRLLENISDEETSDED